MSDSSRPLSPHLQIYRWHITMALSILHRATGVFLSFGAVALVWWLMSVDQGGDTFSRAQGLIQSLFGQLLLFAWTVALFIHLCNGIRHLFWDAGYGFEKSTATKSGWLVVLAALVFTGITWFVALSVGGGQ